MVFTDTGTPWAQRPLVRVVLFLVTFLVVCVPLIPFSTLVSDCPVGARCDDVCHSLLRVRVPCRAVVYNVGATSVAVGVAALLDYVLYRRRR